MQPYTASLAETRPQTAWPAWAAILIVGYLAVSRAFAYIGIPQWSIFIGEVILGIWLVHSPKLNGISWPIFILKLPQLKRLWLVYAFFCAYGFAEILHGILSGYPPLLALRDYCFNYYPLYITIGLWAGFARPDLLPKLLRVFAWLNGLYGVAYLLWLNRVDWFIPGVSQVIGEVPIFGQPMFSFIALLGLITYEPKLWRVWHLLFLNAFVMLGMQLRTEWFAFAIGLATWCALTRKTTRFIQAIAVLFALVALMYFTGFKLPGPESRGGGEISVKQLVDRGLAPFQADTSDLRAAEGHGAETEQATFVWRTVWWLFIWNAVHSSLRTAIFGFGYGYPLGDLAPYLEGDFIRTPHNEFFYALGYTGWIGVVLFFAFQGEIFRTLWRAFRHTGQSFGVSFWVAVMAFGMFFPLGETPYAAIPFYLIVGWVAASTLATVNQPVAATTYSGLETYFPEATASAFLYRPSDRGTLTSLPNEG